MLHVVHTRLFAEEGVEVEGKLGRGGREGREGGSE